jgi:hypothetical protein
MHRPGFPDADRVLRELARLLAPYIAEELERPRPTVAPTYDEASCALLVSPLGTRVLERALALFGHLAEQERVASVELADLIGAPGPRSIGGMLTSPLKRRAKQLGLPLPFLGGEGSLAYGGIPNPRPEDDPGRTYWQDRDGIAKRMAEALTSELKTRPDARWRRSIWEEGDSDTLTPDEVSKLTFTNQAEHAEAKRRNR